MFAWKKGPRQERKSDTNKEGMFTYVWEPLPWKVEGRRNWRPGKARREGTDVIFDPETRERGARVQAQRPGDLRRSKGRARREGGWRLACSERMEEKVRFESSMSAR